MLFIFFFFTYLFFIYLFISFFYFFILFYSFIFLFLFFSFFSLWPLLMKSLWLFVVTSVSGAQIINNPWARYSHIIPPMIKMSNHNITQCGTQATGLGVMISRCSPDSQHGRHGLHPTNVGCSFFRYINDDVTNPNEQRPKRRTWTSNPSQRGYRKRMFEIWQECSTFQTTSQMLADQVRTITKKGWFSDLELLEIHQKTLKQNYNAVPDTPSGVKQKQSNEKEQQTLANENTTLPSDTLSNNQEETLSQEQKVNLENVKRIMNSEKTILPSLRNIEWKTIKIETNKINHILPYIPTNNITELNELINAGAKLVCENIGIPSKSTKKQQKPGWEIRLESQIKKLRKQARMMKRGAEISRGEKEQATWEKITVQLEEINQKIRAKEGRLKRYRQMVKQYRQNRTFQNNEKKFYQHLGGSDTKTYQQPDAEETERFWAKIWEPKKHKENAEWINNVTRELNGLEEGPKIEIHVVLLKTTLKRISNWKAPGHDGIYGFWFKKFTSIHDRLALEMNRCLQDAHVPEWMTKGKTPLIQKDPSKGTAPNNYRPITCLPVMWKILTAQIR